jgi:hypothetical protein
VAEILETRPPGSAATALAVDNRPIPDAAKPGPTPKHRLDYVQTFIIGMSFFASAAAAGFSGYQAWKADEREQRSLRAYVGTDYKMFQLKCPSCDASSPQPTSAGAKTDYFTVGLRNSGQTPAYDLSLTGTWKEMPFGQLLPKGFDYPETRNNNPADSGTLAVNPGDTIPGGCTLTPDEIAMVKRAKDHKATIYLYGDIKYRDVFGKHRLSPYCRIYNPDIADQTLAFGVCPDHNSPAPDDGL